MSEITKPIVLDETGKEMVDAMLKIASNVAKTSDTNFILDTVYSASITKQNITQKFISWWNSANNGAFTKTELLERWFNLLQDSKVYGCKLSLFSHSQMTEGEMEEDSVELGVCVPATETTVGKDNFKMEPAFWTVEVEYEIDSNGEIEIKTVDKVDPEFTRAGLHGMVGVAQKSAWQKKWYDSTHKHDRYSTTKQPGFKPLPECVRPDGKLRAFMVHAKYLGGLDRNGIPTSATGLAPLNYTYSHNTQITEWRKRGANYSGMSGCDNAFRQLMFELKYAKKGNSGTLEGCSSYNFQYTAAVTESNVERVLVTLSQGANFEVGSWCIVGTASGGTDRNNGNMYSIVKNKKIVSKEKVSVNGSEYIALNIDNGGTKFNVTAGTTYISTMPWGSGACDNVLSVDGSPNNTNGHFPFIIQGLETQNGAYVILADVISSEVADSEKHTITPKICRLAKNIATSPNANYHDGIPFTVNSTSASWHYTQDLTLDDECVSPLNADGGAGSSNAVRSAVYTPHSTGLFEWLSWFNLLYVGFCGVAGSSLVNGLSHANWHFESGAPGSGANRGEWSE